MVISIAEQKELAGYIARKVSRELGLQPVWDAPNSKEKQEASVVWNAIEDYAASDYDNGPDILHAHKAATEAM